MTIAERLASLAQRAPTLVDDLHTEEATKNALVLPFISALGYDVFNPREVVPEFTCDIGTKKGEKVDYAIMRDEEVAVLFECKKAGVDLSQSQMNQLYRYFTATSARIGVLTNGTDYWFYSDLEEPNRMDRRPFLSVDLLDLRDSAVAGLEPLGRDTFDLDSVLLSAGQLKALSDVKHVLAEQLEAPHEELLRFFFSQTNPRARFTSSAREQFSELVRLAFQQFITERVNSRLRSAIERETVSVTQPASDADDEEADSVVTTVEEIEAFHIVKALVREVVAPERVVNRDTRSYMGILLDDNNRKPICRLRFNRRQKYLGLFDEQKAERKVAITGLNDIYAHADDLKATVQRYDQGGDS